MLKQDEKKIILPYIYSGGVASFQASLPENGSHRVWSAKEKTPTELLLEIRSTIHFHASWWEKEEFECLLCLPKEQYYLVHQYRDIGALNPWQPVGRIIADAIKEETIVSRIELLPDLVNAGPGDTDAALFFPADLHVEENKDSLFNVFTLYGI